MFIVGIDVAKRSHEVCMITSDGQTVQRPFSIRNNCTGYNLMLEKIRKHTNIKSQIVFAMESTAHYWLALFTRLRKDGYHVILLNPIQTSAMRDMFIRKIKTDAKDSFIIAELIRFGRYAESNVAQDRLLALKELCRNRFYLVDMAGDLKRKLIALIDRVFPEYEAQFDTIFCKSSVAVLKKYPTPQKLSNAHLDILNVTPGTMLACSILYRMGINVTMKGSVLMGTDNVYTGIVYLLLTRMFARDDGSVPMLGLNPSDSVNLETMRQLADLRLMLGLENKVRIEQHVTNFYKGVVAQPFVRRDLLVESAKTIPYMSAKHEGADPSIEATLEHPSNNLEFVLPDKEVLAGNHFEHMQQSFLYGVSELNKTAVELTRNKMAFLAASNLHRRY